MTPKPLLFTSTLPYTGRKGAAREKGGREDEKRKGGEKRGLGAGKGDRKGCERK